MTPNAYLAELAQTLSRSASKTLQALAVWRTGSRSALKYYLDGLDVTYLVASALALPTKGDDRFGELVLVSGTLFELKSGLPDELSQYLAGFGLQVLGVQVTTGTLQVIPRGAPVTAHGYLIESRNHMDRGGAALRSLAVLTPAGHAYEMLFSYYDQLDPESIPAHLPQSQADRAWAGRATADLDRQRMVNPGKGLLVTAGFNGEDKVVLRFGDTRPLQAETAPKSVSKRGGAGRGQGRKPLVQGQRTVSTTVRMPEPLREKYRRLGGAEWMRQALEAAPEPAEG